MSGDDDPSKRKVYLPELVEALKSAETASLPTTPPMKEGKRGAPLTDVQPGAGTLMIFLRTEGVAQDSQEWNHFDNLEGKEWLAIFSDVLHCPVDSDEPYAPGDDLDDLDERIKLEFQQAILDYPMLGRIWDTYIDIVYEAADATYLEHECLRVWDLASSNEVALRGLSKLINVCQEAIRGGSGIVLACN